MNQAKVPVLEILEVLGVLKEVIPIVHIPATDKASKIERRAVIERKTSGVRMLSRSQGLLT